MPRNTFLLLMILPSDALQPHNHLNQFSGKSINRHDYSLLDLGSEEGGRGGGEWDEKKVGSLFEDVKPNQ